MPKIQQLDPHVADLIAAGEVVERPSSVVKELMENAIDAGATSVTVEIQQGGMSFIRVTDNGCGISWEDAETAFLRHATSKIRTEFDLEAIGTLGFRGEALAAISAVSRVELLTRQEGANFGTSLLMDGGVLRSKDEAGGPVGTTMIVRDLFYNTPARLKFIKKDASEANSVATTVEHVALTHPEVSVHLLRDGKELLQTPGDGNLKAALYAVMGRNIAAGFIPVQGGSEEIRVEGFVSLPACCRGSRSLQNFIVNGRYVKSRTMMAALEEAYRNQKMVGKFPGCVLHLKTKLSGVDVNVHPTKTEVKFANEKSLFDAVYYTVKGALEGTGQRVQMTLASPKENTPPAPNQEEAKAAPVVQKVSPEAKTPAAQAARVPKRPNHTPFSQSYPGKQNFFQTMTAAQYRQAAQETEPSKPQPKPEPKPEPKPATVTLPNGVQVPEELLEPMPLNTTGPTGYEITPLPANQCISRLNEREDPEEVLEALSISLEAPRKQPETPTPDPIPAPETEPEPEIAGTAPQPWKVVGELFHTYILVEQGDTVVLIDKHAAHERINFDRLKAQDYRPMSQQLLAPLVFTPDRQEGEVLLANKDLLMEFGFEVEEFGSGALAVRQVPYDIDLGQAEGTLEELAEKLMTSGRLDPAAARDDLLHTIACKAAIKGGQKNGPEELQRVAEAVMADEVRYCPHGRPVAIELTKKQLEKQFKRS